MADDIFSNEKPSIKDAIVSLGGFCTAEIVSQNGLLFTNHHCGYDKIAEHSTKEHNYLDNGFWAKNFSEELPNPGLTASILVKMEDVSELILQREESLSGNPAKDEQLNMFIDSIETSATNGTDYKAFVKDYFNGTEYYLLV